MKKNGKKMVQIHVLAVTTNDTSKKYLTLGGPIIIPVQCVRVMSSSFSRPQLIVPSPTPFWPCSSSSRRRKFRGITETRFEERCVSSCRSGRLVIDGFQVRSRFPSHMYSSIYKRSKRFAETFELYIICIQSYNSVPS